MLTLHSLLTYFSYLNHVYCLTSKSLDTSCVVFHFPWYCTRINIFWQLFERFRKQSSLNYIFVTQCEDLIVEMEFHMTFTHKYEKQMMKLFRYETSCLIHVSKWVYCINYFHIFFPKQTKHTCIKNSYIDVFFKEFLVNLIHLNMVWLILVNGRKIFTILTSKLRKFRFGLLSRVIKSEILYFAKPQSSIVKIIFSIYSRRINSFG